MARLVGQASVDQQLGVLAENMRAGNEERRDIKVKAEHLDECVDKLRNELWEFKAEMGPTQEFAEKLAPHTDMLTAFVTDYSWFRRNIVKVAWTVIAAWLVAAAGGGTSVEVVKAIFHIGTK